MPLLSTTGAASFAKPASGPAGFVFNDVINNNTQYYNLLARMQAQGYTNGNMYNVTITVNTGIYIWSDDTARYAFETGAITGSGLIILNNNGYIIGKGGTGGYATTSPNAGGNGGPAMNLQKNISINNFSYIAGGGGGGSFAGGGGAGGGTGGGYPSVSVSGGAGGAPGSAGGNGGSGNGSTAAGGGGRILPGVNGGGSGAGGGAGGNGGIGVSGNSGGLGGSSNNAGSTGGGNYYGGGGGGWGAAGARGKYYTNFNPPAGNGGKAINLNGNTVTWLNMGSVWGGVS